MPAHHDRSEDFDGDGVKVSKNGSNEAEEGTVVAQGFDSSDEWYDEDTLRSKEGDGESLAASGPRTLSISTFHNEPPPPSLSGKGPMYNLLTPTKLRKSHARSQSSRYIQHCPSNPSVTTERDHHGHDRTFSSRLGSLEVPTLSHQPASTSHPTPELPPLVTHNLPHTHTRPCRPASKVADWFSGESEPMTFALIPSPTKEKLDPADEGISSSTYEHRAAPGQRMSASRTAPKPPLISRFSLFGPKSKPPQAPVAISDLHDEWHDLDVRTALNPISPPDSDPFSPSAFKSLQQNAEGLLLKLQAAYKQRSQALHDVLAEKEAEAEELAGAEMRSRHLKLQLVDMTTKLAEQDEAMMDLVDQLAQEKQARREADDALRATCNIQQTTTSHKEHEGSKEDHPHTERSWKSRTSTASDLSTESEGSCTGSLFSRHGATSPAMSMSSVSTMNSPEIQQYPLPAKTSQRHLQIFETDPPFLGARLLGTKTNTTKVQPRTATIIANGAEYNGHGDSEAWNLVDILKMENQGLKTRVGQLESTVDDCLDMVKSLF
ncbi:MAG: hypothetical protein Q9184_005236 [Pyrenodesmia sp. 2 TL-2023]